MPTIIDIQSPPEDLDVLLDSAMPDIQALDPEHYIRRTVSRPRVLELTNILLMSWAPLIDAIDQELSPVLAMQRKLELGRLDTRAWTFYKADLAAEELFANVVRKQRRVLARAVAEHDRFLFKWATPLFGDDPEHAETLRDISRGTGARDDAEDVLRLVALFRSNWEQVEALQQAVTRPYLDKAAADATRQLDVLRNGTSNPARKLADAAYSLWYRDYYELMHLGRYLCRGDLDAVSRFPGVREAMVARAGEDADEDDEFDDLLGEDEDDDDDDDITDADAESAATDAAPQPAADPNAAA